MNKKVTGQIPNISEEWLDFEFYDLVWWLDRPTKPNFTNNVVHRLVARWIGVSHRVGSDMSYWLITESGKIISKMSVEHVIRDVTTRGWSLLVQWKDGSISWEKLKDLKASNPVEAAKYAVANRLVEEPAFKWWVYHTSCDDGTESYRK
jgi:hypothetical protein